MKTCTTVWVVLGLAAMYSNSYADNKEKITSHQYDLNEKKSERAPKEGLKGGSGSTQKLSYSPPPLGSSSSHSRLVGMALRGSTNDLLLSVLTPEHTGLSMGSQPDIYWYTSKPISKPYQFVEFVLNSDTEIQPILRVHLAPITKRGIQKLSLSDYHITLEKNVEYTWVISLVSNPTARSYDLVTSGKIKHIAVNDSFQNKIKKNLKNQQSHLFAQAGFWYDALAGIIERVEKEPTEPTTRNELTSLLKQVGLNQIVENMGNINSS